jgi:hypothetical protein
MFVASRSATATCVHFVHGCEQGRHHGTGCGSAPNPTSPFGVPLLLEMRVVFAPDLGVFSAVEIACAGASVTPTAHTRHRGSRPRLSQCMGAGRSSLGMWEGSCEELMCQNTIRISGSPCHLLELVGQGQVPAGWCHSAQLFM